MMVIGNKFFNKLITPGIGKVVDMERNLYKVWDLGECVTDAFKVKERQSQFSL